MSTDVIFNVLPGSGVELFIVFGGANGLFYRFDLMPKLNDKCVAIFVYSLADAQLYRDTGITIFEDADTGEIEQRIQASFY